LKVDKALTIETAGVPIAYKIALMRGKKVAVARKAKQLDIEDLLEIKASL
jgi:adenine/guanine phosphoribosyltransferase-like PRPP-binding protein